MLRSCSLKTIETTIILDKQQIVKLLYVNNTISYILICLMRKSKLKESASTLVNYYKLT